MPSATIAPAKESAPSGELGATSMDMARGALPSGPSMPHPAALVKSWLRALLGDGDPPAIPGDYRGPWAEEVLAVLSAHQAGGVDAARRAFDALARAHPGLATLVAGEPEPGEGSTWADLAKAIGPVSWAWRGWLPRGFLTELVGEVGSGKSILALRIAACFLRGDPWPDGTPYTGSAGKAVWCEAEAAQAINVDRAKTWGLALDSIISPLSDPFSDIDLRDSTHLVALAAAGKRPDVRLIVVDSLSGATGGRERADEMMPVVHALAELARDTGRPVLLSHHLRKRGLLDVGDAISVERVRGSTVIAQPARVIWAIDSPDPNEPGNRRLSVIKSNLGRFPDPMGFRIGDGGVSFGDPPVAPRQETQLDRAMDLLRALLVKGPRPSSEIEDECQGAGLSWDTMKRAKDKLGVVAKRDGKAGRWSWGLPARG